MQTTSTRFASSSQSLNSRSNLPLSAQMQQALKSELDKSKTTPKPINYNTAQSEPANANANEVGRDAFSNYVDGLGGTVKDQKDLFTAIDTDRSLQLSEAEFNQLGALSMHFSDINYEEAAAAIQDENGINQDVFLRFTTSIGLDATEAEVLFASIDRNASGGLRQAEFETWQNTFDQYTITLTPDPHSIANLPSDSEEKTANSLRPNNNNSLGVSDGPSDSPAVGLTDDPTEQDLANGPLSRDPLMEDLSFYSYQRLDRATKDENGDLIGGQNTIKNVKPGYIIIVESHGKNPFDTVEENELIKVTGADLVNFGGSHDKYISLWKVTDSTVTTQGDGGAAQALFIGTGRKLGLDAWAADPDLGKQKIQGTNQPNRRIILADDEGGKDTDPQTGISSRDAFYASKAEKRFGTGDDLLWIFGDKLSPDNAEGPNSNGAVGELIIE